MAERERVRLGAGVSIYREYEAWSLEVCRDHKRVRKSLKTRDRGEAIMKAGALLREIEARKAEVDWLPKVHRVAEFLSGAESVGLRYHNPTDPADLFNGRTFDDIAAGSIDRLKSLAHEGFDLEAKIERAVRAATGKSEVKAVECEATLDGYRKFLLGHKGDCEDHVDNVLSQLRRFFASAKVKFTHELTAAHVEDYIASCVGQEGSTRKHKLGIIRAWLEWAKRQKYIETNVAEEVPPPKVFAPDNDCYSKAELEAIFRKLRGQRIEPVVLLAFWTGLDRIDLELLEARHINRATREITSPRHKTGKRRGCPTAR